MDSLKRHESAEKIVIDRHPFRHVALDGFRRHVDGAETFSVGPKARRQWRHVRIDRKVVAVAEEFLPLPGGQIVDEQFCGVRMRGILCDGYDRNDAEGRADGIQTDGAPLAPLITDWWLNV
jgi:hypothetical protein